MLLEKDLNVTHEMINELNRLLILFPEESGYEKFNNEFFDNNSYKNCVEQFGEYMLISSIEVNEYKGYVFASNDINGLMLLAYVIQLYCIKNEIYMYEPYLLDKNNKAYKNLNLYKRSKNGK